MKGIQAFIVLLVFCSAAVMARPTLEDFTRERDLRNVVISPDGRYLAQLRNKDGRRTVTITDLQAPGKPIVGALADKVIRPNSISWGKKDRLLINLLVPYDVKQVERDMEKKKDFDIDDYFMFGRTLSVDVNAKNPVVLMNNDRSARGNVNLSIIHHYLPKDPNYILMEADREGIDSLYKVNVYTGASELLVKGSRFTFRFANDYDGKTRFRFDYLRVAKKINIYELVENNSWNLIDTIKLNDTEHEDFDAGKLVGLYGDNLAYSKKNEKTGFFELLLYKSKEKTYETLVSLPDRDVLYPLHDLRSNQIIGYAVDGDYIRYKFFDPVNQASYDKLAAKVGNSNFYWSSYSESGELGIVNLYSPENPLSYHMYDVKNDELGFLDNAFDNIASKNLSQSAAANYSARDGKKIHAYILLPVEYEKGKTYPLIVMPHGGPQSRDRADYDDFAQFLSTRGYIVIQPNFRGSTGMGKEFEEAGYKQWGQQMQDDLTDAVGFMVKKGYADPAKVCIVGISYGGYAALMGAIKTPELYRCSVSINGVTHLRNMIATDAKDIDDDKMLEKYWYQRVGDPKLDKEMLDANSPALHADKINIPLLVIASTDDHIVDYDQATDLVSALNKNKKDFKFIKLKDSPHDPFYYKKDVEVVYREVGGFVAKYLGGSEIVKQ